MFLSREMLLRVIVNTFFKPSCHSPNCQPTFVKYAASVEMGSRRYFAAKRKNPRFVQILWFFE